MMRVADAQTLVNKPLAIHPAHVGQIIAALAGVDAGEAVQALAEDYFGIEAREGRRDRDKGYDLIAGVAVITIRGVLLHATGLLRPYWGLTGYDGLRQAYLTAITDPEVHAVLLLIHSPGGDVAGCFDLVDTIFATRGEKPIWAVMNESAASAAYALASAADRLVIPRTGQVGSIGTIYLHLDVSKGLANAGVKPTLISHGARKTNGRSEIPLSDEAFDEIQAEIDTVGELFEDTVARNRGMAASKVKAMQAGTFMGVAGVAAGLADAVMAPDAAFRALLAELG